MLLDKVVNKLADYGDSSPDDRAVLAFGARLLANCLIDLVIILTLAHFLGVLGSVLTAYVTIVFLKYFAGGAHAQNMLNCLLVGIAVFTSIGLLAKRLASVPESAFYGGFISVAVVAFAIYSLHAPAATPQKPLKSLRHRRQLRLGAFLTLTVVVLTGIAWLVWRFAPPEFFWSGCLALVWQSLILLPGTQRLFTGPF